MRESVLEDSPGSRAKTYCLHELFEDQVKRTPDATAVVFGASSLTYSELNAHSNRLARFLRERGVGPESLVGVCIESALETIVGLLAVLKAGGAYLPLDPSYPSERLTQMQQDSSPKIILTLSHLKSALPQRFKTELICLDKDGGLWEMLGEQDLEQHIDPDQPAYVIYTSGSTGQPKGVVLTHCGAVNNLQWRQDRFR